MTTRGMGSNGSRDTSWEAVIVTWEKMVLGGGRGRGVKGAGSRNMGDRELKPSLPPFVTLPKGSAMRSIGYILAPHGL